jgi:2'-5' RNA ligase
VAAEVAALEVPPEKRAYHPHVTLGRVRQPVHARGLPALLEDPQTVRFGAIDVDRLTLFLSKLKRGGARYSPVAHAPLGG